MFDQLFIDNEFVPPAAGRRFDAVDPATEERIATLALADAEDVGRAVRSAHRAFGTWRRTTPAERTRLLLKAAALIESRKGEVARLETLDMGKPLRESLANVARSVRAFEYAAGATYKLEGQSIPVDEIHRNFWPKSADAASRLSHLLVTLKRELALPSYLISFATHLGRAARPAPMRSALAAMVRQGFTAAEVGRALPSAT